MTHIDYEKVKSELYKKQDFIVDQIDAAKVLSLLQDIKEFDFNKSLRKFSASLNSEVLFDEIVTHFPIGSRITGEEKSYALPNGNEPDLIFDYKPKIKEEDKKYLIKNCLVFLNQHSCLYFQFVTNHDDYNYSDSKFLLEVEGCLIDLLFSEYYQRHHKEIFEDTYDESGNIIDDGACLKYKFLGDIIEYIKTFIIKNEFLMSLNDNLKIDKDVFYERTIDYGITDSKNNPINTMYILSSDEEKFLKYGISYLVAFDLYDMCLKDPEYAFYNLTNIKKNKDVDNLIPYLRNNNITFMDNDYNSLKKYIKNMTD